MSIRRAAFWMLAVVVMATPISMAQAVTKVDSSFCAQLIKHVPDADVAYQEGIDAHGKPVVPADLPGQPRIELPDVIKIPLTLDLAKTLNLDMSAFPYDKFGKGSEASLGTLSIEGDRVEFNGQPISDVQQDRLAVLCMEPK